METDDTSVEAKSSVGSSSGAVTVYIRCSNGSKFSFQTSLGATVGAFKVLVSGCCDVPVELQRLIYKGLIMNDDVTLESYGLQADHSIYLVRAAAPPTSNTTANAPSSVRGLGLNDGGGSGGTGLGPSLFPGLGLIGSGMPGIFGLGFSEFEQMQKQLNQSPNITRENMNIPIIQNLMNDPDLIMNDPLIREIIDRNPDLAHILNDPGTLRRTLETARNPELMLEMMRNTDRTLSNIESSPEGFNMLRRMYEKFHEPFFNAASMPGDVGSNINSNPFAALFRGNQGAGQTRNRPPNSRLNDSEASTGSAVPNTNPLPNPWSSTGFAQENTTTRANLFVDARAPSVDPLGGLGGLAELEQVLCGAGGIGSGVGGLEESSSLSQIMQNPAVMQMMQMLRFNPQYMSQVRSMLDFNSQLREMVRNPEFRHLMTSPEIMQAILSLRQYLLSQHGRQQGNQEQEETGCVTGSEPIATGAPNNTCLDTMNLFGGLAAGGSVPSLNSSNVPPEQLYATQLSQLQDMGFLDTEANISALTATAGNVHAAVKLLLGNLRQ